MEAAAVKAILPYFGGKRNLACQIVAEFGAHASYFEPFCGSMAVLLAKEPAAYETVCDLNGDLANLARVIQCPLLGPKLYRRLRRVLYLEQLQSDAAERHHRRGRKQDEALDFDAAFDFFVSSWMGRNGVTGTASYNQGFSVRFTPNGGNSGKRWQSTVASIPSWRRRLCSVQILCRDAFEVLKKIPDRNDTLIYCDPPYLEKGATYIHDFEPSHHDALARQLRTFQHARVIVSYYEHPRLAALYPGWTKRCIEVTKAMVNQGMRDKCGATKATEVLLLNGPSLVENEPGRLFG